MAQVTEDIPYIVRNVLKHWVTLSFCLNYFYYTTSI